jgi:hypothetical protein
VPLLRDWHHAAVPGAESSNESLGSQSALHIFSLLVAAACLLVAPSLATLVATISQLLLPLPCANVDGLYVAGLIMTFLVFGSRIVLVTSLLRTRESSGVVAVDLRRNAEIIGLICFMAILGGTSIFPFLLPPGKRADDWRHQRFIRYVNTGNGLVMLIAASLIVSATSIQATQCCLNAFPREGSWIQTHCVQGSESTGSSPNPSATPAFSAGVILLLSSILDALLFYWAQSAIERRSEVRS